MLKKPFIQDFVENEQEVANLKLNLFSRFRDSKRLYFKDLAADLELKTKWKQDNILSCV